MLYVWHVIKPCYSWDQRGVTHVNITYDFTDLGKNQADFERLICATPTEYLFLRITNWQPDKHGVGSNYMYFDFKDI